MGDGLGGGGLNRKKVGKQKEEGWEGKKKG